MSGSNNPVDKTKFIADITKFTANITKVQLLLKCIAAFSFF